jgi:hypothetical protein
MLILAAIGSPSASRNLGQNQIIRTVTGQGDPPLPTTLLTFTLGTNDWG